MAQKSYQECEHRKVGLNGDSDNSFSCDLTGRADADGKGWGYDPCNYRGSNPKRCSVAIKYQQQISGRKLDARDFAGNSAESSGECPSCAGYRPSIYRGR